MPMRPLTEREITDIENFEKSRLQTISNQIVEYFPKIFFFHTVFVVFNAFRSPTDAAVVFTYFSIIVRILMVIGWFRGHKVLYITA